MQKKYFNLKWIISACLFGLLVGVCYHLLFDSPAKSVDETCYLSPSSSQSFHNAVSKASPAVVSIYTESHRPAPLIKDNSVLENIFRDSANTQISRITTNQGSGVVISTDGYIVTNKHLVEQADQIIVSLADRRQFEAKLIGSDGVTDLAVLQINAGTPLKKICMAKQSSPQVGDIALTIGNPYGVGQTVTMGIISATNRRNITNSLLQDYIQIDAPINPGNSGGALINPQGELIGINSVIYAPKEGAQGIGFAIPTSLVNYVVPQLIQQKKVRRGWLGIRADDLFYYPDRLENREFGALITEIVKNSPAENINLQQNDVITHFDADAILSAHDLLLKITTREPGSEIKLIGFRGQKPFTISATLDERPEPAPSLK